MPISFSCFFIGMHRPAWQAQMSDSSESSSDSDDESDDDEEALGVKSKVGPRFANVSGSEAWYLKRNNI